MVLEPFLHEVFDGGDYNAALARLLIERPGDTDRIRELIRDQHVTDAGRLRTMLNTASPLASGVL